MPLLPSIFSKFCQQSRKIIKTIKNSVKEKIPFCLNRSINEKVLILIDTCDIKAFIINILYQYVKPYYIFMSKNDYPYQKEDALIKDENTIEGLSDEILSEGRIPEERLASISKAIHERMARSSQHIKEPDNIDIPSMIDHTLLNPKGTMDDIKRLCDEAVRYQFFSVCVNPFYISRCKELLHETRIKVCTVVGFPLGANMPDVKAFEAQHAESMGADEIDMVINIGALKERDLLLISEEIAGVVNATRKRTITKVILENAYLTLEEKIFGCLTAMKAGADFVKTSTGFAPSGATIKDVALMRYIVGEKLGVKAAGGIRDRKSVIRMIKAGANRIGTSSSVKIVTET